MSPPDAPPPPAGSRGRDRSAGWLDPHEDTPTAVAAWALRVRPHLDAAAEHIVAAGRELIDAKAALAHGDFGALLAELGLTPRTAQRFMSIARHPVLANTTHASHLPAAWTTLFELSRVPEEVLAEAVEDGRVHPGMRRQEAVALADLLAAEAPIRAAMESFGAVLHVATAKYPDTPPARVVELLHAGYAAQHPDFDLGIAWWQTAYRGGVKS